MSTRTTIAIDDDVLKAVRIRAARTGQDEAMELALEAQASARTPD